MRNHDGRRGRTAAEREAKLDDTESWGHRPHGKQWLVDRGSLEKVIQKASGGYGIVLDPPKLEQLRGPDRALKLYLASMEPGPRAGAPTQ